MVKVSFAALFAILPDIKPECRSATPAVWSASEPAQLGIVWPEHPSHANHCLSFVVAHTAKHSTEKGLIM